MEPMSKYACPRCIARGKTWQGDDPSCGFDPSGVFTADNWNCATLDSLRDLEVAEECYDSDQRLRVVPLNGKFIILGWYKARGRVEVARMVDSEKVEPLTLQAAEEWLTAYGVGMPNAPRAGIQ
jgi:hypothetical protein